MGAEQNDLFEYARKVVDHKTVMQRIGHSPALHSARSAFSSALPSAPTTTRWGSLESKALNLAGSLVRVAIGLVTIPAIPSLLASLEKHGEAWLRRYFHAKHVTKEAGIEDRVKFELKDLSLEEMDRYRWKVHQAITDLNTAIQNREAKFVEAEKVSARCTEWVELAKAVSQAERRIEKLHAKCKVVKGVMEETMEWLAQCSVGPNQKGGVNAVRDDIKKSLRAEIEWYKKLPHDEKLAQIKNYHWQCSGWCWARPVNKPPGPTPNLDYCADFLKWLAEPAFEVLEEIGREQTGKLGEKTYGQVA